MMRWAAADNTLVQICGKAAVDAAAIAAACAEQGVTNIGFANINLNADMIVLATPEMAGMPYVISGLVAAGGLAAALSTADGLLLAIANALSHDVYYKMIDQNAPTARRLVVSRILLVVVAVRRPTWPRPSLPTSWRWCRGRSRSLPPGCSRRSCSASGGSGPTRRAPSPA